MSLMHLLAGIATFVTVFLKGFQHKNVIGGHLRLTFITSYAMAIADVVLVNLIVKTGWEVAFYCGTGAATGMVLSMLAHDKWVKKTQ